MSVSGLSRLGVLMAMSAAALLLPTAQAQQSRESIFAKVEPSLRDRAFMRLNYIVVNVKTSSSDTRDVTGPVLNRGDIKEYLGPGTAYAADYAVGNTPYTKLSVSSTVGTQFLDERLNNGMELDANNGCETVRDGLGTPCGIKARSGAMVGTPAVSVGYFFNDEYTWFVEAFVLAAPLRVSVYGDGNNNLNGREIIQLKLLPPVAILGRYFGEAQARVRPFVGFGASYAMFFDTKATSTLNTYQGGRSPGDTSVSLKNAMGYGPFAGVKMQLDDDWHINLNIGKIRFKTEATLITRNTTITGDSEVLKAYGPAVQGAMQVGEELEVKDRATGADASTTTAVMCLLAKYRDGREGCNLGTFVRKQSTVLDNTMFMLSVGRRF